MEEKLKNAHDIYLHENIPLKELAARLQIPQHTVEKTSIKDSWVKEKRALHPHKPCVLDDPAEYDRIRETFVTTDISLPELAKQIGITHNRLRICSQENHWHDARNAYRSANGLHSALGGPLNGAENAALDRARDAYIAGEGTLAQIAEKYALPVSQVCSRAFKERWTTLAAAVHADDPDWKPRGNKRSYDWTLIEADYVSSDLPLTDIARRYGITPHLVCKHKNRGDWDRKRMEWHDSLRKRLQSGIEANTSPSDLLPCTPPDMPAPAPDPSTAPDPSAAPAPPSPPIEDNRFISGVKFDYEPIRTEYVTGFLSLGKIADTHGIPRTTLLRIAGANAWAKQRREYRQKRREGLLNDSLETESIYQLNLRKRLSKALEGIDGTMDRIMAEDASPEDWKQLLEAMIHAETLDRRTGGRLTVQEQANLDLQMRAMDLKEQRLADETGLARRRLDLETEDLHRRQAAEDKHAADALEHDRAMLDLRREALALEKRRIELAEKIEEEKNAPKKPVPVVWGDPLMAECAL